MFIIVDDAKVPMCYSILYTVFSFGFINHEKR
jgi:hypothetical protein